MTEPLFMILQTVTQNWRDSEMVTILNKSEKEFEKSWIIEKIKILEKEDGLLEPKIWKYYVQVHVENMAHVQMPEENKNKCRNYELLQFEKIPKLLSISRPLTHTKFTILWSTFSCVEFGLAYWQHLNLRQKK